MDLRQQHRIRREPVSRAVNLPVATGADPDYPFRPGDEVRIIEGPFRDMLAVFHGPATPAQRVQVLLEILGRASRVQVEVTDLEKVTPGSTPAAPKRSRRTRGQGRRLKG